MITTSTQPAPELRKPLTGSRAEFGEALRENAGMIIDPMQASEPLGKTARVARAFRGFMDALDLDPSDPHLRGTEWRVARAYDDLLRGFSRNSEPPALRTFPNEEGYAAPVTMTGIPFYSLCAHHFLPFFGEAHIIYTPADRVVGLSKLARAVDYLARRPQVQERLTEQLADMLDRKLRPKAVLVVVQARHLCMEMRGARSSGMTTTSAARGAFIDVERQKEFLAELRLARTAPSRNRHASL